MANKRLRSSKEHEQQMNHEQLFIHKFCFELQTVTEMLNKYHMLLFSKYSSVRNAVYTFN